MTINSPVAVVLSLLQLINMMFLEQQPLVFNNQQWAANSTCICVNPDLSFSEVPYHRNLKKVPGPQYSSIILYLFVFVSTCSCCMCIKVTEFSLLCSSRKYPCLTHGRDLLKGCHPSGNYRILPTPRKFQILLWGGGVGRMNISWNYIMLII